MDGRELSNKLNYEGMIKEARRLAIEDKLATIEELAEMTELEICSLISQNYKLVYETIDECMVVA